MDGNNCLLIHLPLTRNFKLMQSLKKLAPPLVPLSFSLLSALVSMVGVFPPSYAVAQTSYSAIKNAGGKCMDVQNGYVSKDGTPIQIWDCNNTTAQQWQVSGETIRNAGGKCLDIQSGAIFNEGQPVWTYGCNATNAQRWIFTSSGEIRNPVSNKCLDVKNGWIGTSGTTLQIYSCNGTPAQKWSVASVSPPPVNTATTPLSSSYMKNLTQGFGGWNAKFGGYHTGYDIATANSNPSVYAIADGEVVYNATSSGNYVTKYRKYWNGFVIIKHGNFYAYYGHLNSPLSNGSKVSKGSSIGSVRDAYSCKASIDKSGECKTNSGSDGSALYTGNNHLHISISTGTNWVREGWGYQTSLSRLNQFVNPAKYIGL